MRSGHRFVSSLNFMLLEEIVLALVVADVEFFVVSHVSEQPMGGQHPIYVSSGGQWRSALRKKVLGVISHGRTARL